MSNRAVSATYRTIIDDVIANVRQDFEDMGIEKEVLDELQRSWEAKIVATGVADFEGATPFPPQRRQKNNASGSQGDEKAKVKQENGAESAEGSHKRLRMNGDGEYVGTTANGEGQSESSRSAPHAMSVAALMGNSSMPMGGGKTNGIGNGTDDEDNANKRKRPISDNDEIGSDLDDSDEDEMEGNVDADGNEDMILCLYDKVQRVRNKWKCVLKDGIASIDGRDYVFSKLSSELEW